MIPARLIAALLRPAEQSLKLAAIDELLRPHVAACAKKMQPWWAWTAWLGYAITVRRIENA